MLDWQLAINRQHVARSDAAIDAAKLDQQIGVVDARLDTQISSGRGVEPLDASRQLTATAGARLLPAYYMTRGRLPDLELDFTPSASDSWVRRFLAAIALAIVGCAAAVFLRSRTLPAFPPWVVIGAAGFAWWLLLSPSFVGLVILAVAGWAAVQAALAGPARSGGEPASDRLDRAISAARRSSANNP